MPFVSPNSQLVVEVYVRNLARSRAFYEHLGFKVVRDDVDFVELTWDDHRLFLASGAGVNVEPGAPVANVRIMVPDVDHYWKLVVESGARIIAPIDDRYYGLRDFTIADPDGFGLRFATPLAPGRNRIARITLVKGLALFRAALAAFLAGAAAIAGASAVASIGSPLAFAPFFAEVPSFRCSMQRKL